MGRNASVSVAESWIARAWIQTFCTEAMANLAVSLSTAKNIVPHLQNTQQMTNYSISVYCAFNNNSAGGIRDRYCMCEM